MDVWTTEFEGKSCQIEYQTFGEECKKIEFYFGKKRLRVVIDDEIIGLVGSQIENTGLAKTENETTIVYKAAYEFLQKWVREHGRQRLRWLLQMKSEQDKMAIWVREKASRVFGENIRLTGQLKAEYPVAWQVCVESDIEN